MIKKDSFWKRIDEAYNNHHDKNFQDRKPMKLKGWWHKKINPSVQKFVGCYKDVVAIKKAVAARSTQFQLQMFFVWLILKKEFYIYNTWKNIAKLPYFLSFPLFPANLAWVVYFPVVFTCGYSTTSLKFVFFSSIYGPLQNLLAGCRRLFFLFDLLLILSTVSHIPCTTS